MTIIIESESVKQKAHNAYKTIGEVSLLMNLPPHVLRFWELKFPEIAPYKNNSRRYYSPENINFLNQLKVYIYEQGYTIKGVQNLLMQNKNNNRLASGANQLNLLLSDEFLPVKKESDESSKEEVGSGNDKIMRIIDRLTVARDKLLNLL